jgi:hypothetical protein
MSYGENLDPNTEGPYWNYTAASDWANFQQNMWARIVADYVVAGDLETAQRRAIKYVATAARVDRISERYEATKDTEEAWIGWTDAHAMELRRRYA